MFYTAIQPINILSSILLSKAKSLDYFLIFSKGITFLNRIKHELINTCGVSDKFFQCQDPLPEVGTQRPEGKMYRLLVLLLCDVFLEKEKDLFL